MPSIINIPLSDDRKREICGYLCEKFEASVKARRNQIDDKYTRWMDNYSAKPLEAVRTTPWYRSSNFVPQLIRMHTDILSARLSGIILGTHPMWRPKTFIGGIPHEWLEELSDWMEFVSFYEIGLQEPLDSMIFRTVKTGTIIAKGPWVETSSWTATEPAEGEEGYSSEETREEGVCFKPVPFDDFWVWPITVADLTEVTICFHRLRLTKEDVRQRADSGTWDRAAVEELLKLPSEEKNEPARQAQAEEAGFDLTQDVDRPFSAVESWFEYPITPGKNYRIVIVFNPRIKTEGGILRAYFNPYRRLRNCFCDVRILPREDFFYGYCIPEILEQSQEEQAQIHNARRDSNTIGNVPTFKKLRYADVPNPSSEWYPGKTFELNSMQDLDVFNIQANYNSMIEEEGFLLQLAERYTGVSPPMQGYGAGVLQGKRGIYNTGGTLALLAEGNRRIDVYIKRLRYPMHRIGNLIYQSYRNFRPSGAEYTVWGEHAEGVRKSFDFREPEGYRGLFFEIGASEASANKEVDRTNLLLMANTMAAYYRQIVEAGSVLAQTPEGHPLRGLLLAVLEGAKDLADRLLFSFDIPDRRRLVPDVQKILGGGAQPGASPANGRGMPGAQEPLSVDRLRTLQTGVAALTGGGPTGVGERGA